MVVLKYPFSIKSLTQTDKIRLRVSALSLLIAVAITPSYVIIGLYANYNIVMQKNQYIFCLTSQKIHKKVLDK